METRSKLLLRRAFINLIIITVFLTGISFSKIPKGDIVIKLETVATGLTAPIYATHADDGSGRLQQHGSYTPTYGTYYDEDGQRYEDYVPVYGDRIEKR